MAQQEDAPCAKEVPDVTAVEARGLTKKYGDVVAADGIDLVVPAGGVHGLLGPNGAGKTTFLRMLLGLVRPDAGTLRVREGVAGFAESPRFYPYLSAERNLALLADLDGGGAADRIDGVLQRVGLDERRREKAGGYSHGMRQRLGIAAALLRAPQLLVLDEPADGLDPAGIRAMRALVGELAGDGRTVLLSSHHMTEVEELCDTVTIMCSGRVVYSGTVEELRGRAPDPAHRLRTSDDAEALTLAGGLPGVRVGPHPEGGLTVHAEQPALDAFAVALGRAGVAVRALRLEATPLESLFFRLTEDVPTEDVPAEDA
ncbi:ABC transporter ATP-binding protein [Streptomyces sp. NPDC001404]|uniref:ABC transporter ATP-binding protein n=1 Tax=Streptomyces sp. NPDC001404 TaxID=3364571 RepID=UPI0036ACD6D4